MSYICYKGENHLQTSQDFVNLASDILSLLVKCEITAHECM